MISRCCFCRLLLLLKKRIVAALGSSLVSGTLLFLCMWHLFPWVTALLYCLSCWLGKAPVPTPSTTITKENKSKSVWFTVVIISVCLRPREIDNLFMDTPWTLTDQRSSDWHVPFVVCLCAITSDVPWKKNAWTCIQHLMWSVCNSVQKCGPVMWVSHSTYVDWYCINSKSVHGAVRVKHKCVNTEYRQTSYGS